MRGVVSCGKRTRGGGEGDCGLREQGKGGARVVVRGWEAVGGGCKIINMIS